MPYRNGICSGLFDISSSMCGVSANITVTVFATNVLGDGLSSEPIDTILIQNSMTLGVKLRMCGVC